MERSDRKIFNKTRELVARKSNSGKNMDIREDGWVDFYYDRAKVTQLDEKKRQVVLEEDRSLTEHVDRQIVANIRYLKRLTSDSNSFEYVWKVNASGRLKLETYYNGQRRDYTVKPRVKWEHY